MRYIVDKKALSFIDVTTRDATGELSKPVVITGEPLHFKNLPFISVILMDEQVELLRSKGIEVNPEQTKGETLAADYQKTKSAYYLKAVPKGLTGKGVKVAIMDTGCIVAHCPVDFAVNFADETEGVGGANASHGQMACSVMKSEIGLCNDAIVHCLKVITGTDEYFESAFLAAMDYCIEEQIDIINMSFSFSSTAFDAAVATFISGGGIVVAAAGNDTSDAQMKSPAKLADVVSVNSISEAGTEVNKNVLNEGGHGITVACSGVGCEVVLTNGSTGTTNGTSFSAPFFVGMFACFKEELSRHQTVTNAQVLQYILDRCIKQRSSKYFGYGVPTF